MDVTLDLTDEEWMSLIDGDRDGLPRCCSNISALRDSLIDAARNNGRIGFWNQTMMKMSWCFPSHEHSAVMQKIMDQTGWQPAEEDDHEPQRIEL